MHKGNNCKTGIPTVGKYLIQCPVCSSNGNRDSFHLLFLSFLSQEEEGSDSDLGQGQNEFFGVIMGRQH